MKKVMGIFFTMVMVFVFTSMAFGSTIDWRDEVIEFCNENDELKVFIPEEQGQYNIINGVAYAIGMIGDMYSNMDEFMEHYSEYLEENWPEMAQNVKIEFTYTGSTEHSEILCVWLDLVDEEEKTFHDYCTYEPEVRSIAALVIFDKE